MEIDEFAIMPNHVHAIIIIDPSQKFTSCNDSGMGDHYTGTIRDLSLQPACIKIKSLSELVGAFKTISSKEIHHSGFKDFRWQRSFYDHIIRNEKSLYKIRQYIQQNPLRWEIEKDMIENLEI